MTSPLPEQFTISGAGGVGARVLAGAVAPFTPDLSWVLDAAELAVVNQAAAATAFSLQILDGASIIISHNGAITAVAGDVGIVSLDLPAGGIKISPGNVLTLQCNIAIAGATQSIIAKAHLF